MFQPHDKVVCINGDFRFSVFGIPGSRFHAPHGIPREGEVYSVRAVMHAEAGTQGLYLVGLSTFLDGEETGFNSTRFRKVEQQGASESAENRDAKPQVASVNLTSHEV